MQIDHVLIATADLDAAAARLESEHGLVATGGGRHQGVGTHNRIVPLGGGYLELIAVADPAEAASTPLGRALAERIAECGEGLMAWVVAVSDVTRVAERLGTELSEIARKGLTARLTGVAAAMTDPSLPFFIERDPGIADPGADGDAGGITWIELSGDADRLEAWLGADARLPVRVAPGPPGIRAVGIGSRELR
jgi:hypothetical protein